jgi:hypothetical protein
MIAESHTLFTGLSGLVILVIVLWLIFGRRGR